MGSVNRTDATPMMGQNRGQARESAAPKAPELSVGVADSLQGSLRARKAAAPEAPPKPTMLQRIGDWAKSNPMEALLAVGFVGGAVLLGAAFALPAMGIGAGVGAAAGWGGAVVELCGMLGLAGVVASVGTYGAMHMR